MQTHLHQIEQIKKIQLKQQDLIGKGSFANVYRYKIHNIELAIKCFKDERKAIEENAVLQKIQSLVPGCPEYYGIQKLDIEIIGAFSEIYMGYAIFFQVRLLDFSKMLGIVDQLQIKEVFNFLSQMGLYLLCLPLNTDYSRDIKPPNILTNQNNKTKNY